MENQNRPQAWQANVRAMLHLLHQSPLLEDKQLRNLHIKFLPSLIPTSTLVRNHLPAFLESKVGQNLTWNLDYKRRNVIEDPEDWPLRISEQSTKQCIKRCMHGLGDQIWGERNYETKRLENILLDLSRPLTMLQKSLFDYSSD